MDLDLQLFSPRACRGTGGLHRFKVSRPYSRFKVSRPYSRNTLSACTARERVGEGQGASSVQRPVVLQTPSETQQTTTGAHDKVQECRARTCMCSVCVCVYMYICIYTYRGCVRGQACVHAISSAHVFVRKSNRGGGHDVLMSCNELREGAERTRGADTTPSSLRHRCWVS
jgi:hypothetical protein